MKCLGVEAETSTSSVCLENCICNSKNEDFLTDSSLDTNALQDERSAETISITNDINTNSLNFCNDFPDYSRSLVVPDSAKLSTINEFNSTQLDNTMQSLQQNVLDSKFQPEASMNLQQKSSFDREYDLLFKTLFPDGENEGDLIDLKQSSYHGHGYPQNNDDDVASGERIGGHDKNNDTDEGENREDIDVNKLNMQCEPTAAGLSDNSNCNKIYEYNSNQKRNLEMKRHSAVSVKLTLEHFENEQNNNVLFNCSDHESNHDLLSTESASQQDHSKISINFNSVLDVQVNSSDLKEAPENRRCTAGRNASGNCVLFDCRDGKDIPKLIQGEKYELEINLRVNSKISSTGTFSNAQGNQPFQYSNVHGDRPPSFGREHCQYLQNRKMNSHNMPCTILESNGFMKDISERRCSSENESLESSVLFDNLNCVRKASEISESKMCTIISSEVSTKKSETEKEGDSALEKSDNDLLHVSHGEWQHERSPTSMCSDNHGQGSKNNVQLADDCNEQWRVSRDLVASKRYSFNDTHGCHLQESSKSEILSSVSSAKSETLWDCCTNGQVLKNPLLRSPTGLSTSFQEMRICKDTNKYLVSIPPEYTKKHVSSNHIPSCTNPFYANGGHLHERSKDDASTVPTCKKAVEMPENYSIRHIPPSSNVKLSHDPFLEKSSHQNTLTSRKRKNHFPDVLRENKRLKLDNRLEEWAVNKKEKVYTNKRNPRDYHDRNDRKRKVSSLDEASVESLDSNHSPQVTKNKERGREKMARFQDTVETSGVRECFVCIASLENVDGLSKKKTKTSKFVRLATNLKKFMNRFKEKASAGIKKKRHWPVTRAEARKISSKNF